MPIKFKLKVMLAMRDMNQRMLSDATGIRPPTISAICNNSIRELPISVLEKICVALDCQPGDIIVHVPSEKDGEK